MNAERKKEINGHLVEEYYWNGKTVVYIDNLLSEDTFEKAVVLCGIVDK